MMLSNEGKREPRWPLISGWGGENPDPRKKLKGKRTFRRLRVKIPWARQSQQGGGGIVLRSVKKRKEGGICQMGQNNRRRRETFAEPREKLPGERMGTTGLLVTLVKVMVAKEHLSGEGGASMRKKQGHKDQRK